MRKSSLKKLEGRNCPVSLSVFLFFGLIDFVGICKSG